MFGADSKKDRRTEQHTGIMVWIYGSLVQRTVSGVRSALWDSCSLDLGATEEPAEPLNLLWFSVQVCSRVYRRQQRGLPWASWTMTLTCHLFPRLSKVALKQDWGADPTEQGWEGKWYKTLFLPLHWCSVGNAWKAPALGNFTFCHNFIIVGHFFGKRRKHLFF